MAHGRHMLVIISGTNSPPSSFHAAADLFCKQRNGIRRVQLTDCAHLNILWLIPILSGFEETMRISNLLLVPIISAKPRKVIFDQLGYDE